MNVAGIVEAFDEEMTALIKQIARAVEITVSKQQVQEFFQKHFDEIVEACVRGEVGYYIGYHLSQDYDP